MNKPEILWTSDVGGTLSTQIGPVRLVVVELTDQDVWEASISTDNGVVMHIDLCSFWMCWKLAFAIREIVDHFNGKV